MSNKVSPKVLRELKDTTAQINRISALYLPSRRPLSMPANLSSTQAQSLLKRRNKALGGLIGALTDLP